MADARSSSCNFGIIAREEVINKCQDSVTMMAKLQELDLASAVVKGKK